MNMMGKFVLCFHHEIRAGNLIVEDQNFGLVTQAQEMVSSCCNIRLGNMEDLACLENITEIGLPKIRRGCVDWILLA